VAEAALVVGVPVPVALVVEPVAVERELAQAELAGRVTAARWVAVGAPRASRHSLACTAPAIPHSPRMLVVGRRELRCSQNVLHLW
jgi:hypothetical protein